MSLRNNQWKRAYNKLAEDFFDLQHEYDVYRYNNPETDMDALSDPWAVDVASIKAKSDPWAGCACGNSSTCGTTFTVDPFGVVDRPNDIPNLSEGRYTVLIKKEKDTNV